MTSLLVKILQKAPWICQVLVLALMKFRHFVSPLSAVIRQSFPIQRPFTLPLTAPAPFSSLRLPIDMA
jgi:hypothetical protein